MVPPSNHLNLPRAGLCCLQPGASQGLTTCLHSPLLDRYAAMQEEHALPSPSELAKECIPSMPSHAALQSKACKALHVQQAQHASGVLTVYSPVHVQLRVVLHIYFFCGASMYFLCAKAALCCCQSMHSSYLLAFWQYTLLCTCSCVLCCTRQQA